MRSIIVAMLALIPAVIAQQHLAPAQIIHQEPPDNSLFVVPIGPEQPKWPSNRAEQIPSRAESIPTNSCMSLQASCDVGRFNQYGD